LSINLKNLGIVKKVKKYRDESRRNKQNKEANCQNKKWDKKLRGLR
jgi:hypothetical protein